MLRDGLIAAVSIGAAFTFDALMARRQEAAENARATRAEQLEDARVARAEQLEEARAARQEVLENLRYVRERSGDPGSTRPSVS